MRKRSKGTELYDFRLDHCFDNLVDWYYVVGVPYGQRKRKATKKEIAEIVKDFYERIILPVLKEDLADLLELAKEKDKE